MTTAAEDATAGSGMELNEALRRIFVQHWLLICIAVLLGAGAGASRTIGDASFTATTRLVLDAPDPRSSAESMVIADTVRAIATSQTQMRSALTAGGVTGRDPIEVARDHVSVSALGTSGVVQLSVNDPSGDVAAAIVNALAREIIRTRLSVSSGRTQLILANLSRQLNSLNRQISRADATSRPLLLQQRAALESDRASILAAEAAGPKPSIISQARAPGRPDATQLIPFLILGGILGLVIGVAAAALLETVRPTLVGGPALAREFGTRDIGATGSDDVLWRVGMVAATARTPTVGLISAGGEITSADLAVIASRFDEESTAVVTGGVNEGEVPERPVGGRPAPKAARLRRGHTVRLRFRPFFEMVPGEARDGIGLLLVTPTTLRGTEVVDVKNLLALVPYPILGLLTHEPPRRGWRERRAKPAGDGIKSSGNVIKSTGDGIVLSGDRA